MALWDRLVKAFSSPDKRYLTPYFPIGDSQPVVEGTAYCRIWLVEMRLARGVDWFKSRYPMVCAATRYDYGGKQVTVPYVGGLDYFKELTQSNLDRVIQLNRPLTPRFPFNRDIIDFQVGLFSVAANDPIRKFLGFMGQLSNLIPVPELSSVLKLIDPIYQGIEDLLDAGESKFELGYQQAFVGAGGVGSNQLRKGFFAAILATEDQIKEEQLQVIGDNLRVASDDPQKRTEELKGYSYMLFRIDTYDTQDWESLSDIKQLVERAQNAIENKKPEVAKDLLTSIKIAIARSPDVTKNDRAPMFAKIEQHLKELGLEGALPGAKRLSLYAIMQKATPAIRAEDRAEIENLSLMLQPPPEGA